jgi:hypothetical protein
MQDSSSQPLDLSSADSRLATDAAETRPKGRPPIWGHVGLFLATLATTTLAGVFMSEAGASLADDYKFWTSGAVWLEAFSYSLPVLAILFSHEMGHYLTARRRGVDASRPYFIPAPPSLSVFGTLGAFIRMRLQRRVRGDTMLRIGAYGPIAGFVVCVPVLAVGLALSDIRPAPEEAGAALQLGDSLLLMGLERIIFGDVPTGQDIWLHPMAFAGWAGLLVTALNLLPLGQLDGGHVAYCLMGERFNRLAPYFFGAFLLMTLFLFAGWLLFLLLVLFIGFRHPPICYDLPVRGRDRIIGWVAVAIFVLCFMPTPIHGVGGLVDVISEISGGGTLTP